MQMFPSSTINISAANLQLTIDILLVSCKACTNAVLKVQRIVFQGSNCHMQGTFKSPKLIRQSHINELGDGQINCDQQGLSPVCSSGSPGHPLLTSFWRQQCLDLCGSILGGLCWRRYLLDQRQLVEVPTSRGEGS
ncbi:MAG: hypothetical protein FRX49_06566 [Trebouxia sp. A1-2]|nr:MAG: hypothetical protein FRX49_06566 [Trebouxia sp. A1-2]